MKTITISPYQDAICAKAPTLSMRQMVEMRDNFSPLPEREPKKRTLRRAGLLNLAGDGFFMTSGLVFGFPGRVIYGSVMLYNRFVGIRYGRGQGVGFVIWDRDARFVKKMKRGGFLSAFPLVVKGPLKAHNGFFGSGNPVEGPVGIVGFFVGLLLSMPGFFNKFVFRKRKNTLKIGGWVALGAITADLFSGLVPAIKAQNFSNIDPFMMMGAACYLAGYYYITRSSSRIVTEAEFHCLKRIERFAETGIDSRTFYKKNVAKAAEVLKIPVEQITAEQRECIFDHINWHVRAA